MFAGRRGGKYFLGGGGKTHQVEKTLTSVGSIHDAMRSFSAQKMTRKCDI